MRFALYARLHIAYFLGHVSINQHPEAAAHLEAMIERTERRGEILQNMVDVCVALSKKLARDMLDGPFHPESRHDTARAFDFATRSLRLAMAVEARVDAQLFALRNDELPVAPALPKDAGGSSAVQEGVRDRPSLAGSESDHEAPEVERRESETERLVEYDRFDLTDIHGNVEAIQANIARLPPSPEVGRVDSPQASGVGECASSAMHGGVPDSPTPDFASLSLDPPHFGGGMGVPPPPRE